MNPLSIGSRPNSVIDSPRDEVARSIEQEEQEMKGYTQVTNLALSVILGMMTGLTICGGATIAPICWATTGAAFGVVHYFGLNFGQELMKTTVVGFSLGFIFCQKPVIIELGCLAFAVYKIVSRYFNSSKKSSNIPAIPAAPPIDTSASNSGNIPLAPEMGRIKSAVKGNGPTIRVLSLTDQLNSVQLRKPAQQQKTKPCGVGFSVGQDQLTNIKLKKVAAREVANQNKSSTENLSDKPFGVRLKKVGASRVTTGQDSTRNPSANPFGVKLKPVNKA